jgi:hypothetical protein
MDQRKFDRLTRLFGAPRSRRTAWRALLGAALLGATIRPAAAAPCANDTNARCMCGETRDCDPGKCVTHDCGHQLCCSGEDWIICGNVCCQNVRDACKVQVSSENRLPNCIRPIPPAAGPCESAITGSYRRR